MRFQALLRFQIGFVWRFLGRRDVVREALPDAIALSRLACRVRTFVGQDSILVVRRVINDTSGIVSHDRTEHSLCHRLAVLPFIAATRLHLALLIPHLQFAPRHLGLALRCLAFVICHLPSVVRHPTSVIRLFYFSIPHPKIRNPQFPKLFQRSDQLAVPGGLVPPVSLEARAAIQRRAVVPLVCPVCLDFLAGVSGGRLSAARPASFSSSGERPPGGDPAFLAPRNLGRALSPPSDGQTAGARSERHELYVCPLPLLEWSKLGC